MNLKPFKCYSEGENMGRCVKQCDFCSAHYLKKDSIPSDPDVENLIPLKLPLVNLRKTISFQAYAEDHVEIEKIAKANNIYIAEVVRQLVHDSLNKSKK